MFFALSKIFWIVAQPLTLSCLLILAGTVLAYRRHPRSGLIASGLGILLISVASFTTLGQVAIAPLEERFARPSVMPAEVDYIILLGGGTISDISTSRQVPELNAAGDRLTETLRLAQLYPQARIVVSGGTGFLASGVETEAMTAGRFFGQYEIDPERLLLEDAARNTDENATETRALLSDDPGTLVLVTSAFHMPRSVGLFRKVGLEVVAWPSDYRSPATVGLTLDVDSPVTNLDTATTALREWIGLAVYRMTGRIDAWFPDQTSN
jgi:uncharacterized SAM-binding protein YcdF (DUF218 family)